MSHREERFKDEERRCIMREEAASPRMGVFPAEDSAIRRRAAGINPAVRSLRRAHCANCKRGRH